MYKNNKPQSKESILLDAIFDVNKSTINFVSNMTHLILLAIFAHFVCTYILILGHLENLKQYYKEHVVVTQKAE